jgi:hypothetical protein
MHCKYNNRGGGVFYVVHIYPLLGNGCVFYGSTSRLHKWCRTKLNQNENEDENENGATPQQSRKKGLAEN